MRRFCKYSSLLIAIFSFSSFSITALAQETSQPPKIDAQNQTITLNVLVTDSSNRAVTDLRQEEFRVLEDGKEQAITHFSREELPVSYGVMIDASGSMRALLSQIIETGRRIVAGNKAGDESFVMRFVTSDNIKIEQGFTTNTEALYEALDNIYVEGGYTAVIDAANRSFDFLKKYRRSEEGGRRRQAMVLITDGEDRGSSLKPEALLNRLRGEDVQFFIVGLTRMTALQSRPEKAIKFLESLAEASGGRVFFPKSISEIPGIVNEITRDLHTQYVIGYTPTNLVRDGSFRKVQVTVPESQSRKKLKVITRSGYKAG